MVRSGQDVLAVLARDHDALRAMLVRLDEMQGDAARSLLVRLRDEVRIHAQVEDELVYPAYAAMLDDEEAEKRAADSRDEHEFVNRLLDEILSVPSDSVSFGDDILLAREALERHTDEEEDVMFPRMERACSQLFLQELGQRVTQRKQALRRQLRRRRSVAPEAHPTPSSSATPRRNGIGPSKTELIRRLRRK